MAEPRTTERLVVITGAAGGIGSALVNRFLVNGDIVLATDADDAMLERLRATCAEDAELIAERADVSSEADCARVAARARDRAGRVDVLVNCAGFFPIKPFAQMTPADWRRVIDVNLTGAFLMTHAVLPLMTGRGRGRIVNIGSAAIFSGVPGQTHYVAAKAGLVGFTRSLARELGDDSITVNAVTPGLTVTPPVRDQFSTEMIEQQRQARAIKRDEQAADLVGPVFFLASPDADFVTGQILNVDGGSEMH